MLLAAAIIFIIHNFINLLLEAPSRFYMEYTVAVAVMVAAVVVMVMAMYGVLVYRCTVGMVVVRLGEHIQELYGKLLEALRG